MIDKYLNDEHIHSVINWLFRAHEITKRNGFSIGFDLRKGWLAPYSETTGYIIPTLYRYAIQYNDSKASDIATSSAMWLISIQNDDGSIFDFKGNHKKPQKRSPVVFNTGQDLFGLLAAYHFTGNNIFLKSAKIAAEWIISKQDSDGLWNDNTSSGSTNIATYYSHVTWPLYLVGKELSDEKIMEQANVGLNLIIKQVNDNLSVKLWGFNDSLPAFTHTIAYTIEGMLMQGLLSYNQQHTKAFTLGKKIAYKIIDLIEENGKLAGSYDEDWNGDYSYVCMPGNCQFAILFFLLYNILRDERCLNAADKVLEPVLKKQHLSKIIPSSIRGTVPASWPPVLGKYMRWMYPNWAAKYLADAIMLRMHVMNEIRLNDSENSYFDLLEKYSG